MEVSNFSFKETRMISNLGYKIIDFVLDRIRSKNNKYEIIGLIGQFITVEEETKNSIYLLDEKINYISNKYNKNKAEVANFFLQELYRFYEKKIETGTKIDQYIITGWLKHCFKCYEYGTCNYEEIEKKKEIEEIELANSLKYANEEFFPGSNCYWNGLHFEESDGGIVF